MKLSRRTLALSLILILSIISIAAAPAAPSKPFAGLWKGNDAVDGSKAEVKISAWGNVYNVAYTDKSVAACGGGAAKGTGGGSPVGNVLYTSLTLKCVNSNVIVATNYNLGLSLNGSGPTLTDVAGTVYFLRKQACVR